MALELPIDYINLWEGFHKSIIGTRRVEELTVCYLSGPEPLNDFNVLVDLGIHPHNIWAFESDNKSYNEALSSIHKSEFPMLKIHKGNIEQFFIDTPKKFDIVYIDACGPLPSQSQHTIRLISTLLRHHRLNSPGALITNFACPDFENIKQKDNYLYLVSNYLFPKNYLESIDKEGSPICIEGPSIQNPHDTIKECFSNFVNQVKNNFDFYYGQYITRQIFDIASVIIPWIRILNSGYWNHFFNQQPDAIIGNTELLNINDEPYNYPLQWVVNAVTDNNPLLRPINSYFQVFDHFMKFQQNWLGELCGFPAQRYQFSTAIQCYDILRSTDKYYTERLKKSVADFNYKVNMFQFCDVPSKTLGFDLVVNQLSYPMHYSTDSIKRWKYKAKSTEMFLDAIIMDECRYIYEWLPTVDLINCAFTDKGQQLSYRFALDGLIKTRMFYNTEYFFGASIVSRYEEAFKAKILESRIML